MTMKKYLKKRIIPAGLSLILIIMTVISIMPINVSAEDSLNVIEISRVNELIEFANKCKYDSYSKDKIVKLTADIDVSGSDFKGISYFAGTFDGGSHIISGFNVDYKGSDFGFFRYIAESGFITNLNISGSINVTGSQENIGGIAGVNKGVINESSFSGKVNASTATGAIAGYNHENAKIVSCTSDADILATNQTGGIAGVNDGLISSCTSKSRVNTQELDTTLDIGGVDVGTLNLTQNVIDRNDMGGIAGESTGIISDCVNYGKIGFAHTGYNVGGIAGKQSGKVITCSNEGEIYGRKDVGGIVGQAEPDIESEYLNDRVDDVQSSIDIINSTLNNMSSSMNNASSDVKSYTENIIDQYKELLDKLQDKLNGNNDNDEKIEDFVDDISKDIENSTVADDIHGVADTVDSEIRTIADSIERISAQIKNIGNTVTETMDVVTSDDDYIEDISSADSAQNSDGVIAKSVNRGAVHGDINAGGIAGEIVNSQTIRSQSREEYCQDGSTACNDQRIPVAQPNVEVRGLRKFTAGNILDVLHQVTARQELQRLRTQSSVAVRCVHDHDVQRNQTDQCQQDADNEASGRFQSLNQHIIVFNTNVFHYAPRPPFFASFCCFLYSLTRALRSSFFRCSSSSRFIRNTRIPRAAVMINRITEAAPAMP